MGAMVSGLYWELAPSIRAEIVHALKSSTHGFYAGQGFKAILSEVVSAGIPII